MVQAQCAHVEVPGAGCVKTTQELQSAQLFSACWRSTRTSGSVTSTAATPARAVAALLSLNAPGAAGCASPSRIVKVPHAAAV